MLPPGQRRASIRGSIRQARLEPAEDVVQASQQRIEASLKSLTTLVNLIHTNLQSGTYTKEPSNSGRASQPVGHFGSFRASGDVTIHFQGTPELSLELGGSEADTPRLPRRAPTSWEAPNKARSSVVDEPTGDHELLRRHTSGSFCPVETSGQGLHGGFVAPTLPLNWPSVLRPRGLGERHESLDFLTPDLMGLSPSETHIEYADPASFCCWPLRNPNSYINIFLEICGAFVLAFDLLTVPFVLSWNIESTGTLGALTAVSLGYWTLDICMSFIRGFFKDGELVSSLPKIARHYMKTWFLPDVSIVMSEWFGVLLAAFAGSEQDTGSSSDSSMRILRLAKMGKMVRLIGVLRIFRLARIVESFLQRSISENVRMALRIGAMSFAFLWLNHMVTCAWHAVGRVMPTNTHMHWIDMEWQWGDEVFTFKEATLDYQYITAFHWAMAQTTLGAMEITPTTTFERAFNVLCLLIGLLFGSTLVSSLSATMVEVQVRNRDRTQKLHTLRRFLVEHNVNRGIALKVQRQVAERLCQRLPLVGKDVPALDILSSSLQQDLHMEICRPHLITHPLFRTWSCMDAAWFRKFCHIAVEINSVRSNDEIFTAGTEAVSVYYLMSGRVQYWQEPESAGVRSVTCTEVEGKTWLCESCIWSEWTHVGTAEAVQSCQLLVIVPDEFWKAVKQHIVILAIAREYCVCFHRRIVSAKPPHAVFPTDIEVPFTDVGDIVYSMSQDVQKQIGLTALATLQTTAREAHLVPQSVNSRLGVRGVPLTAPKAERKSLQIAGWEKLHKEVVDGTSVVVLNSRGKPERVVSLVILSLVSSERGVLYNIGSMDFKGELKGKCALPAIKRHRDELTSDALNRLLATKMSVLQEHVHVDRVENIIEEKESKEYGVHTTYLRKICHAELDTDDLDHVPVCGIREPSQPELSEVEMGISHRGSDRPTLGAMDFTTKKTSHTSSEFSLVDRFAKLPVHFLRKTGEKVANLYVWLSADQADFLASHIDSCVLPWLRRLIPAEPFDESDRDDSSSAAEDCIDDMLEDHSV